MLLSLYFYLYLNLYLYLSLCLCLCLLPITATLLNKRCQVSPFAKFHHNVDGRVFTFDDPIVISNNVRVAELPKEIHFGNKHLFLTLVHLAIVELFPNQNLT